MARQSGSNARVLLTLFMRAIPALALLATIAFSALSFHQTRQHFRLERTSGFVERFNSPELIALREDVDAWVRSGEDPASLYRRDANRARPEGSPERADADAAHAMLVKLRTLTNYFQEFGTAIKHGMLDERYAFDLLGGVCIRYANDLEPYILATRVERNRTKLYAEVLSLRQRMLELDGASARLSASTK